MINAGMDTTVTKLTKSKNVTNVLMDAKYVTIVKHVKNVSLTTY